VIDVQAKNINWFALVGAILVLVVLVVSIFYPWWQLIIGDNLLIVNASPMNTNFGLLGTPLTIPLILALNIGSILTFLASGIVLLIYAVVPTKPYAKDLLSFSYRKPLYAVILMIAVLLIVTFSAQSFFGVSVPLQGRSTIYIPSSFMMGLNASVGVLVTTGFVWPFCAAIVAAALCIVARIYHTKLNKTPKQETASNKSPAEVPLPPHSITA
jgi:hypothetical protein